jgi:hypothetical protein
VHVRLHSNRSSIWNPCALLEVTPDRFATTRVFRSLQTHGFGFGVGFGFGGDPKSIPPGPSSTQSPERFALPGEPLPSKGLSVRMRKLCLPPGGIPPARALPPMIGAGAGWFRKSCQPSTRDAAVTSAPWPSVQRQHMIGAGLLGSFWTSTM